MAEKSEEEIYEEYLDNASLLPSDDRLEFERQEIAGLAQRYGGKRVYKDGIGFWQFPPWYCPHCTKDGDLESLPKPGCPSPLARHGPLK